MALKCLFPEWWWPLSAVVRPISTLKLFNASAVMLGFPVRSNNRRHDLPPPDAALSVSWLSRQVRVSLRVLGIEVAGVSELCSSFRAELIALQAALKHLLEFPAHEEDPIVVCTDSRSALMSLQSGPAAQNSPLGIDIWRSLRGLAAGGRQLFFQWVS